MALLIVGKFFTSRPDLAYEAPPPRHRVPRLRLRTDRAALNAFAAAFHPAAPVEAILVLNALLGLGTVTAPVFVAIFSGSGSGGACRSSLNLFVVLVLVSVRLPLRVEQARAARAGRPEDPPVSGSTQVRAPLRRLQEQSTATGPSST